MIVTTPNTATSASIDGPAAGLTITARLRNGAGVLTAPVAVNPRRDMDGIALDSYTAGFTAPALLPVVIQWLNGASVIGSEVVSATAPTVAGAGERSTAVLEGAPAGLTITARLKDGNAVLPLLVTVTPLLDAAGAALDAYTAAFILPATSPIEIEWLQGTTRVGLELLASLEVQDRGLLARMTSADTEPILSATDLDTLLALSRIPDARGLNATDAGWTATHDLNFAAAEGWRWKAGKAASSYAFTMDGESPERSFLMIRCEKMAAAYSAKIITSVPVSSGRFIAPIVPLI